MWDNSIAHYSRDEIVGELEREAHRRLGISAEQLFREYRNGQLQDIGAVADLIVISDLLGRDDPIFR